MVSGLGSCRINLDYTLGDDDRVVRVCPQWSAAARARLAHGLDDDCVLGRRLWDFVHGGATQRVYDALLHHARRAGQKIQFNHRGDSPDAIRYMRLSMIPDAGGQVRLRSELLHEQSRHYAVYFTHVAFPRRAELMQCGLCQRLEYRGRWHGVDALLADTDLIDPLMPTEVGDTVCDNCITKLELSLGVRL